MIKYTKSNVAPRPTYRTEKFGNLLSDTYQGEIYQNSDGTWSGWLMNLSDTGKSEYEFGLQNKGAATRFVNQKLRERGVDT